MKCDFCDKVATSYGAYQCYLACDDHTEKGEEIENKMWKLTQDEEE